MVACGGRDQFTAHERCAKWAATLKDATTHQDASADHFWRDPEAKERLLQAVEEWARHDMH